MLEKLPRVKDCVIVRKVNFLGCHPWGGMKLLCDIILIDPTCGYVVGKYELVIFVVEKVGKGQIFP